MTTKYDPIRSDQPTTTHTVSPRHDAVRSSTTSARASPSISSLIDPPLAHTTTTTVAHTPPSQSRFGTVTSNVEQATWSPIRLPPPSHASFQGVAGVQTPPSPIARPLSSQAIESGGHGGQDLSLPPITMPSNASTKKENVGIVASNGDPPTAAAAASTTRTIATSPLEWAYKPARHREPPAPPAPTGSGLLSSASFGGPKSAATHADEFRPPTIILDIPIKRDEDRYFNFAKLAEERYGFAALHPRLAARQDRLARVAAAGAALERAGVVGSPDEESLDVSDSESNAGVAGTEGSGDGGGEGGSGSGGPDKAKKKRPRKRRAKEEEYSRDDPFIDDTDMLWQEQAAASKDGFFVYEGPLIKPGELPTIER